MIRSLRLRFFLTVWPLVVAAVLGVGLFFGVRARVELRREAEIDLVGGASLLAPAEIERVWSGATTWDEARGALEEGARRAGVDGELWAVDASGHVAVRSSDALVSVAQDLRADGTLEVALRLGGPEQGREVLLVSPVGPITPPPALAGTLRLPLHLYHLPASALDVGRGADEPAPLVRRLDRSILAGVVVAGLVAALATLLLAGPVVGSAASLASTARRIRGGDLSARVGPLPTGELADVAKAFDSMAAELERSEAARTRMVADAAHELRTPLTNLVGTLEAVEDGVLALDGAAIESLREEVRLLERLVEDLQELALADAGALSLSLELVDVGEAAERALETFRATSSTRGVRLTAKGHGRARADRLRLAQILRNLLGNALRHAPEGGQVRVVVAETDGGGVSVRVEDDGPGIPPSHRDRIWDRFHRIEPARDRTSGGSGLGLSIVRRLVESHGGSVFVGESPEGGAAVGFTLPGGARAQ